VLHALPILSSLQATSFWFKIIHVKADFSVKFVYFGLTR
jgi:hypothetical protein